MSFWQSQSGTPIDGSAENAHVGSLTPIPNDTTAPVSIKSIDLKNFNGDEFYQAVYRIIEGDYKGRDVRHNIKCFQADKSKRDREVNMLMRLYKVCGKTPPEDHAPDNDELLPLRGSVIGVKIQEWFFDGKEGNWISEIHPVDDKFKTETGIKAVHDLSSAFSRNESRKSGIDDDVPF
jgi:hypothetical protein